MAAVVVADVATTLVTCESCNGTPCVWKAELGNASAHERNTHEGTSAIPNSTRRRITFQFMDRVINGIGKTGVRKRHPNCVEDGIHTLFPDKTYMGFKEK